MNISARSAFLAAVCVSVMSTPAIAQTRTAPADSEDATPGGSVMDIVVTAQKRQERYQDVPSGITVVQTSALFEQNQIRIQDYAKTIPGLTVSQADQGRQLIVLRGVSTGRGSNPTVGVTIDDVPVGVSLATASGDVNTIDLDPSDLSSVQVLKGPQGTLYGASSMGGLIKYVTRDPSLTELEGFLQAGVSTVAHGDQLGVATRGRVSVPLVDDRLAVSASGYYRYDPGYVDDITGGIKDKNSARSRGGRVAVVAKPADNVTIKLGAIYQDLQGYGASFFASDSTGSPTLSGFQQRTSQPSGTFRNKTQLYSANINIALGFADLTSTTGYGIYDFETLEDFPPFGPGVSTHNVYHNRKFSQEIRLSSAEGTPFEWMIGGFYTKETNDSSQTFSMYTQPGGALIGNEGDIGTFVFPTTYKEYALLANIGYNITSKWKVAAGARYVSIYETYDETDVYPLTPQYNAVISGKAHDKPITYLFTTTYEVDPSVTVYGRIASGYRPGGPNSGVSLGLPSSYDSDRTVNYELGAKGRLFDRLLGFDLSLFDIEWSRIQIGLLDQSTGYGYFINSGKARSRGAELSLVLQPATGLTINANMAYVDATLRSPLPAASGAQASSGARLPWSSKFAGRFDIEQVVPLGSDLSLTMGAAASYVGDRFGGFQPAGQLRAFLPAYTQFDLRLGLKNMEWSAFLFANNVTDRRGLVNLRTTSGPYLVSNPSWRAIAIMPRTIGLTVSRNF